MFIYFFMKINELGITEGSKAFLRYFRNKKTTRVQLVNITEKYVMWKKKNYMKDNMEYIWNIPKAK